MYLAARNRDRVKKAAGPCKEGEKDVRTEQSAVGAPIILFVECCVDEQH